MNVWIALFALVTILFMPGCSVFDTKEDIAVTPPLAATPVTNTADVSMQTTVSKPTPIEVPRATQIQVIGVIRELRANGCIVKKVANTDGIQYSQLVVTCADPQAIPVVE